MFHITSNGYLLHRNGVGGGISITSFETLVSGTENEIKNASLSLNNLVYLQNDFLIELKLSNSLRIN